MKTQFMLALSTASFLVVAGCHRAAPVVASQPVNLAPVAKAAPAPAPNRAAPTAAKQAPATVAANRPTTTARPATLSAQDRTTLEERLAHLDDALFDYDKYSIRADASTALKDDVSVIRGILAAYPSQKLLIEGHADKRGSDEYNLALGEKRARAAEDFLSTGGIPKNQLMVVSLGKEKPVCDQDNESCWQKNRRAHITAAK
jgi:peptidoglycan-associated lipoprotein